MRLAIHQFAPAFGARDENLERIEAALRATPADLWVLPELATTGYDFVDRAEAARLAEPVPGPSCDRLARLCADTGASLVVGLAERDGEALYNTAAYLGPGGLLGRYRKVHLFEREARVFAPGPDPFQVFPCGEWKLGLMICFDWIFPEAARSLALLGADLIAHPSNLVLPYCHAAMVTRALENGVFVATANRVGTEARAGRSLTFTGGSRVIDPRGRVLAAAGTDTEETIVVNLDPAAARDKMITEHNHRLADRRPGLYRT
jgi:predicted amidohydrolase